jgi:surface protein
MSTTTSPFLSEFSRERFNRLRAKRRSIILANSVDFPTTPIITSSEQKISLLMPVFEQNSNFLAFTISGAYTVDWGDGVTENIASGVKAQHAYSYTDPDLNATVTSDGYKMAVVIITPQSGQNITSVNFNQKYTLTNSVFPDSSPILEIRLSCPNLTSLSLGSSAANSVFCKNLVNFSGINMGLLSNLSHSFGNLISLRNIFLNNLTNVANMTSAFNNCFSLVNVSLSNTENVTNMSYMFNNCRSLETVPLFNTSNVVDMSSMFSNCFALTGVPLFDTIKVTNMQGMFNSCLSLKTVPLFNTSAVISMGGSIPPMGMFNNCDLLTTVPLFDTGVVTDMSYMFNGCDALVTVPLFNTGVVTYMTSVFSDCSALISVPLFNTINVISMQAMFNSCTTLKTVPLFKTSAVTNMSSMFDTCTSLTTVPLFNTIKVTNMQAMFDSCTALKTVPLFNTVAVQFMGSMFNNCTSLTTVPLFNTGVATDMSSMFNTCNALVTVPLFNTVAVTNMNAMFSGCSSLVTVPLLTSSAGTVTGRFTNTFLNCISLTRGALNGPKYSISYSGCELSKEELESIFDYLDTIGAASQTITVTSNWGAPTPVTLTGTTTAGSTTITMANTTGIAVGMQITGTGSPLTSTRAVTFTDAGDLVNLASHGLSNGDEVSFATIVTTTGIVTNRIYYVVNAATGTFQVAATLGGPALALTTNGSGTLRYRTQVVSINPNVSITVSRQMAAGGANSLTFRQLRTGTALLKGWAVTA